MNEMGSNEMGSGPISILIKQERRWKQAADGV